MCKLCDKRIYGSNENSNYLVFDVFKKKFGMIYLSYVFMLFIYYIINI